MSRFRTYEPLQGTLFGYVDPQEQIASCDPARFVDELVEQLDLSLFEQRYSRMGSKGYDPRLHLKLFLFGYMEGVFSSRKLMRRCQRDLAFVFLCRGQAPDFRTIARFRALHESDIKEVFVQIVAIAREMGMGRLGRVVIDATTMKANASRAAGAKVEKLDGELGALDEYLRAMVANDEGEDKTLGEGASENELPAELGDADVRARKMRAALARRSKLREAKAELEQSTAKSVNTTDPDSRVRRDGATGQKVPGYGCQAAMSEDGLLIEAQVVNEDSDHDALTGVVEQACANVGQTLGGCELYADSGYYSVANIEAMQQAGIDAIIPDQNAVRRMRGKHPKAIREGFSYDEQSDAFICPLGERLGFHGLAKEKDRTLARRIYKNPAACRDCPLNSQCAAKKTGYKTIKFTGDPHTVNAHSKKLEQPEVEAKYKRWRKGIEKVFGHIKGNLRFRQFLCRGLERVTGEWALLCTAYNLIRMHLRREKEQIGWA